MPKQTKQQSVKGGTKDVNEDDVINDGNETEKEYEETESENSDDAKSEVSSDEEDVEKGEKEEEKEDIVEVEDDDEEGQIKFKADDDIEDEQDDDTCLYKIKKKLKANILESDDLDDELFEDEKTIKTKRVVKPEDRITKPILTKFERVRLLSERRRQLILGAKPMVNMGNRRISEKDIATIELNSKVIPLIIVRTLPNGDIEHWKLSELDIVN